MDILTGFLGDAVGQASTGVDTPPKDSGYGSMGGNASTPVEEDVQMADADDIIHVRLTDSKTTAHVATEPEGEEEVEVVTSKGKWKAKKKEIDTLELVEEGSDNESDAGESDSSSYGPKRKKRGPASSKSQRLALLRPEDPPEKLAAVRVSGLRQAASSYENYKPPLPRITEREFLRKLERQEPRTDDNDIIVELIDFCFYYPDETKRADNEFCGLHELCVSKANVALLLDGIVVTSSGERHYVERVRFTKSSIGNYLDLETHGAGDAVWIQSDLGAPLSCWYKPTKPSNAYAEYWYPFKWLASFSKHFVDYMDSQRKMVTLKNFESHFNDWIQSHHGKDADFKTWHKEFGRNDFRQAVVANWRFLWQQLQGVPVTLGGRHTELWKELQLENIPPIKEPMVARTVTTPLVHQCFEPIFGENLMRVEKKYRGPTLKAHAVEVPKPTRVERTEDGLIKRKPHREVRVGDVIGILPDEETQWKRGNSSFWFAYVHEIYREVIRGKEHRKLGVIWLYLPEDTLLRGSHYPYPNELFFSNHCNCNDGQLEAEDVVVIFSCAFFAGPGESGKEYFIRQKLDIEHGTFMTFQKSDLNACPCLSADKLVQDYEVARRDYKPGDTVLIITGPKSDQSLEPAILDSYVEGGDDPRKIRLRVLYRMRDDLGRKDAKMNELVYSDEIVEGDIRDIDRKCRIRFFKPDEPVATPYDRDGCGGCFFIRHKTGSNVASPRLNRKDKRVSLEAKRTLVPYPFEHSVRESYLLDEDVPKEPLAGMDLFCGGGNFGRGIEEGGAVVNKWAVDLFNPALCTYGANNKHDAELYLGSVNNFLKAAIEGRYSEKVPHPDKVGFISAGSPCQGFSNANPNKYSEKSTANASLVASVASFVDFYRPKYALLENVHGMAAMRKLKDGTEYNVFAIFLASLVAMGYQVQHFTMDAWSHGSCQLRTRLFVSIAAPGETLPPRPPRSHSHHPRLGQRALFEAPNGKKYAGRDLDNPVPFKFVTAREGFKDLPYIGDAHPNICIPFPDHRPSRRESTHTRMLMHQIPVWDTRYERLDTGLTSMRSLKGALFRGIIDKTFEEKTSYKKRRLGSKAWSRVDPQAPCRTITTSVTPQCDFTGQWLHHEELRLLTVQEVRRAQSFPDNEVLMGTTATQFHIVGNSVDRKVALALGISIREAWFGSSLARRFLDIAVPVEGAQQVETQARPRPTVGKAEDFHQPEFPLPVVNNRRRHTIQVGEGIDSEPVAAPSTTGRKTIVVSAGAVIRAKKAATSSLAAFWAKTAKQQQVEIPAISNPENNVPPVGKEADKETEAGVEADMSHDSENDVAMQLVQTVEDTIVVNTPDRHLTRMKLTASTSTSKIIQSARRRVIDDDEDDDLASAPPVAPKTPPRKRRHSEAVPAKPLAEPSEDELNIPSSIRKSNRSTPHITPASPMRKRRRPTITEPPPTYNPPAPATTASEQTDSEEGNLLFGRFETPPPRKQKTVTPQKAPATVTVPRIASSSATIKKTVKTASRASTGGLRSILARVVSARETVGRGQLTRETSLASSFEDPIVLD